VQFRPQLTLRVCESDGKGHSLGLSLAHISSRVPDPTAIRTDIWRKLHLRNNWHCVSAHQAYLRCERDCRDIAYCSDLRRP
jgi:hypothetical protein